MKKIFFITVALATLTLQSCQCNKNNNVISKTEVTSDSTDIPFSIANNYFVKNTVKELNHPKIESENEFNTIFGMATTMGNDGKPTEINFSKQYVIAIVKPITEYSSSIEPVSLKRNNKGEIVFTYHYKKGRKQTSSIQPNIAIIVDKSERGKLTINELH